MLQYGLEVMSLCQAIAMSFKLYLKSDTEDMTLALLVKLYKITQRKGRREKAELDLFRSILTFFYHITTSSVGFSTLKCCSNKIFALQIVPWQATEFCEFYIMQLTSAFRGFGQLADGILQALSKAIHFCS